MKQIGLQIESIEISCECSFRLLFLFFYCINRKQNFAAVIIFHFNVKDVSQN